MVTLILVKRAEGQKSLLYFFFLRASHWKISTFLSVEGLRSAASAGNRATT